MANWLLGAVSMQVLMATGAADDAGVDPVAINRASARMLSGADCEHDDELKTGRQVAVLVAELVAPAHGGVAAAGVKLSDRSIATANVTVGPD